MATIFADRVKIARGAKGIDINPSVQHVLNCGDAGSCHGGFAGGVYQWIQKAGGVSTETSQPYLACSSESTEGFCPHVDLKCSALYINLLVLVHEIGLNVTPATETLAMI